MTYKISNLRKLSTNKVTYRADLKQLDCMKVLYGIGLTTKGFEIEEAVGKRLLLYTNDFNPGVITSEVMSLIIDENGEVEVNTVNSTYRFKIEGGL